MIIEKDVIVPVAPLRHKCSDNSNQETQCLYGETVKILKEGKKWSFCETKNDNYKGWLQNKFLGNLQNYTHIVSSLSTYVYSNPDYKSKSLNVLFLNSKIRVLHEDKIWAKVELHNNKIGFIFKKSITAKNKFKKSWIKLAKKFIETPYLWGGKTSHGIDCSGLVQTCLQNVIPNFPRNSNEQQFFKSCYINDVSNIEKGCLIFWKGHVAIAISNIEIIHSNIFHMCVKIENIKNALERIEKISGKILSIRHLNIK